ncbi:MAG: glycerate kinase [Victivallales bacterium]|nr:glycerate kinase [Victivallales bacterium]
MKIVIAPDSFKGCLRSPDVCAIIADAYLEVFPNAEITRLPLADGGEGTTEALVSALDGEIVSIETRGPLGEPVTAEFGIADDGRLAVMEMAEAAGIELLSSNELNPMCASTFGVGEMILDAIERGAEKILIGIGGSATVDGGIGMASALGYRFLDSKGRPVASGGAGLAVLTRIEKPSAERAAKLAEIELEVASDVDNPLTGPNGAARVYGPQKGATPEMVEELDPGLENLRRLCVENGLVYGESPGDGAAGGLGFGLRAFCDAKLLSGAGLVCDAVGLDGHLEGASLLITGEGRTDSQTLSGKLCAVVAERAKRVGVPTLLISGAIDPDGDPLSLFDYAFSSSSGQTSLERLLAEAETNLRFTALNTARLFRGLGASQETDNANGL